MGRASRAGQRHGEFGPAQARHSTDLNGPCRAQLPVVARGPARHGTIRYFFIFLFFYLFYFFFSFWAVFMLNGPCPTGQTCLTGRRRASRAVPEVRPRHAGRPGTARLLIGPAVPCLNRAVPAPCRAGPARLASYSHEWSGDALTQKEKKCCRISSRDRASASLLSSRHRRHRYGASRTALTPAPRPSSPSPAPLSLHRRHPSTRPTAPSLSSRATTGARQPQALRRRYHSALPPPFTPPQIGCCLSPQFTSFTCHHGQGCLGLRTSGR